VVARQEGKVIFCMAASFQAPGVGPDHQVHVPPDVPHPDELPRTTLGRLFSMESRLPPQPFATTRWPTRFWARCSVPLPEDPLVHACVLTYLSDVSTGLSALRDESAVPGPSLDHAVWFHRPVELDCWVLMDLQPRTTAGGRGFYAGSICSQDGTLAASFVQESLFRPARSPLGAPGPRSPDVDGRHGGAARVAEKGKCT
jgi:acyl-CoA thioesterase-2